jgi:hypothetical protein
MVLFAAIVFFVSGVLLVGLFYHNIREYKTGRATLGEWRLVADDQALQLKELIVAADLDLKKIPPIVVHLGHVVVHYAALEFAHLARQASRQSHRLADFVSHKRNFQRSETRSEFLRKMTELKKATENGQVVDESVES